MTVHPYPIPLNSLYRMRGMRRLGALGLDAHVRSVGPYRIRQSSSKCAASSSGSPQPPTPSSSAGPSTSAPSRQLIAAAALGGGALGAIAGVVASNAAKNGEDLESEGRGGATRKSRQSEMRRLSLLRQQAIDQEQEQSTSPVRSARDVPWYGEVAKGMRRILDAATLLQSEHPFLEDDHMFSAFLARGIINDIEGYVV